MDFVANSTPMVDYDSRLNLVWVKRERMLDLLLPELPIRTSLKRRARIDDTDDTGERIR